MQHAEACSRLTPSNPLLLSCPTPLEPAPKVHLPPLASRRMLQGFSSMCPKDVRWDLGLGIAQASPTMNIVNF